jgi:hypothetical protein
MPQIVVAFTRVTISQGTGYSGEWRQGETCGFGCKTARDCVCLGQFNNDFECGCAAGCGVTCVVLPPPPMQSAHATMSQVQPLAEALRLLSTSSPATAALVPVFSAGVLDTQSQLSDSDLDLIERIQVPPTS